MITPPNIRLLENALENFHYTHACTHTSSLGGQPVTHDHTYRGWKGLDAYLSSGATAHIPGHGNIRLVTKVGGEEGQGEHMHMVLAVTSPDGACRLFRKDGYWTSYDHDGGVWDGRFFEVRETRELRTVYREIAS